MQIAVAQVPSLADKAQVLAMIEAVVRDVPADLVVFPEGVMHAFDPDIDLSELAEPLDGPFVSALQSVAQTTRKNLVVGCWERSSGDDRRVWNTLVVVDISGSIIARYRKIHLFDSFGFQESERVIPGEVEPVTFDLDGVRLGLMTCYDLRFPELARCLVARGTEVLVLPAGWIRGEHKLDHWRTLTKARAIENTVYLAAAGLCGGMYVGHSTIVDPLGGVLGELGDDPGVLAANIEPSFISEVRQRIPSLQHRRL